MDDEHGGDGGALDEWMAFATEADDEDPGRRRRGRSPLFWVALALGALTLIGLIVLRPTGTARQESLETLSVLGVPSQFHAADIVAVDEGICSFSLDVACRTVTFRLTAGPDAGSDYLQEFVTDAFTPDFSVGKTAVLSYRPPQGTVLATRDVACEFAASEQCTELTIQIGDEGGRLVTYQVFENEPEAFLLPGDEAIVSLVDSDRGVEVVGVSIATMRDLYQFADFQRRTTLVWVALLFVIAVVVLGRWRGLAALAGLVLSIAVIMLFVVPAILDGRSPVWVAVVGASAIAIVALYLAHGFNDKTTVALLGTIGALVLTAVLSAIVVAIAEISGFAAEESSLLTLFDGIDVKGLVLAGIVLGAAGALDDVTITQASAVWELRSADPRMSVTELTRRGLRIGRDHIASTVNTLLLAYAGASLPLLILFVLSSQSLGTIANSEVVAVEIIRTLVGSTGLVAAVPFTTWLAARVASAGEPAP